MRHHEKLDGSGYPLGLRGEELSLPERVVAVADIVSALARARSYKEAFDRERVLAILGQMQAAGAICPQVTALVCNHYDRLMESARAGSAPVLALYQGVLREYRASLGRDSGGLRPRPGLKAPPSLPPPRKKTPPRLGRCFFCRYKMVLTCSPASHFSMFSKTILHRASIDSREAKAT